MATIRPPYFLLLVSLFITFNVSAHKIYAPNDIPLLDNRFRIDPNTQQVTIILNHKDTPQKVVLVRPDGSKLYAERHPKSEVAWLSNKDQDIITVENPMPGPWQAIAKLHGDNRIQLLNPITLKVEKLPLKLYHNEYLTTHVSLLENGQLLTDKDFLHKAKLTVSLVSPARRLISLYKDDGQSYDALPFDGKLSTYLYIDLSPGRYLLNIKTKNNIFVRTYNQDAVVFPSPVTYQLNTSQQDSEMAELTFTFDKAEVIVGSITIDGRFSANNSEHDQQSIIHLVEHRQQDNSVTIEVPLTHDLFNYSAKVFATTKSGREISFDLPEKIIELLPPYQATIFDTVSQAAATSAASANVIEKAEGLDEDDLPEEQDSALLWWIIGGVFLLLILTVVIILLVLKRKSNAPQAQGLSLDELTQDDLQPTAIDINSIKNNRDDE